MIKDIPIGGKISIISRMFKKEMDQCVGKADLTGVQFGVLNNLIMLEKNGINDINQRMLEDIIQVTHPTMTEIIKKLEKNEYIICSVSKLDRRHKCISSTKKAEELINKHKTANVQVTDKLLKNLTDEQIYQFDEILNIILDSNIACSKGGDGNV